LDAGLKHPDNAAFGCLKKIYSPDQIHRDEKDGIGEGDGRRGTDHEQFREGQEPLWHTVNRWEKNGRSAQKMERCRVDNTVSGQ